MSARATVATNGASDENGVEAYAADHARIPQIKLVIASDLHVDVSFAIVGNSEFNRTVLSGVSIVSQLEPLDNCSLLEI